MKLHNESHLDHGLTEAQIAHVLHRFADREAFTLETIELPEELGTVPCGLHGPIMGDPPVSDGECVLAPRGTRAWTSRLCERAPRQVRTVTVIAGPHDGELCVVHTMFGGPLAPQEPGDLEHQLSEALAAERSALSAMAAAAGAGAPPESDSIRALRRKIRESCHFWREHALSR